MRDDRHPQRQRQREVEADHREHSPPQRRRDPGQEGAGVEVRPGLVDGDVPDPQHLELLVSRQHRADGAPQLRSLGCHVEGEQSDGEQLEHSVEQGLPHAEDAPGDVAAEAPQVAPDFTGGFSEVLTGEVDAEPSRKLRELLDVVGKAIDQQLHLIDDQRDHQADEGSR